MSTQTDRERGTATRESVPCRVCTATATALS